MKNRGFITNGTCFHRDCLEKYTRQRWRLGRKTQGLVLVHHRRCLTRLQRSAASTLLDGAECGCMTRPRAHPHWTRELASSATADLLAGPGTPHGDVSSQPPPELRGKSLAVKQQENERQKQHLLKGQDESTRQKAAIFLLPARRAGSARPARLPEATSRPTTMALPCSTAAAGRNLPASLSMLSDAQPVIHQLRLLFCVGRDSTAPASVAVSAQLCLREVSADESLAHLFSRA